MTRLTTPNSFSVHCPEGPLSRYVSHYWLSLSNAAPVFAALPDGCVDLVLEVATADCNAWIYGSTTRPTDIACSQGAHYLGIRFHPGQSRHFVAAAADEITDRRTELHGLMDFPTAFIAAKFIATGIVADTLFTQLDRILTELLCRAPPIVNFVDHVLRHVETHYGIVRIDEVARRFGKSRRQVERAFLQTVGMPLKFFCTISRMRHAAALIVQPSGRSLSGIASETGYSDQAHMTRDFRRLAGTSPGQLPHDVAFFQYHLQR